MHQFISTEVPQASVCNLDCVYCYIPKNKQLTKIHKKWAEKIRDGTHNEVMSEYFNGNLQAISFWGGEPTLGMNDLQRIDDLLDFNKNLTNLSTSTNFARIENLEFLIKKLDDYQKRTGRNLHLGIQVSLDGTKENTEKNRGKGTYDKVVSNLLRLKEFSKEINFLKVRIHIKATNTAEDYEGFAKNPQTLKDFLDSFNYINNLILSTPFPENWDVSLKTLPTLSLPGDYTKEDGENFYKYHVELKKLLDTDYKNYVQEDDYIFRFRTLWATQYELNRNNFIFQCSAGNCQLPIDPEAMVHMCHGSFWFNQENYLEETENSAAGWCEGERIVDFDADKFWNVTKSTMVEYRDKYNFARSKYTLRCFNDMIDHYLAITYSTILMLAKAGQISEIYKDDDWAKMFAYFLVLKSGCWMNGLLTTGSIFVMPLSIYRIYGNGTFEFIVRDFASKIL
jgi:sulfatase maturation enzyme AslB (radical SAM superfamily)